MLHGMKKRISQATKTVEVSAEFEDYKQRLADVKKNLQIADTAMTDAQTLWTKHMMSQRAFSQSFSDGYPTSEDEISARAREFAESSRARYDDFIRHTSPEEAKFHQMQRQVQLYIEEISAVEGKYKELISAKSEQERYQKKLDKMEEKKKPVKDEKKARNMDKYDAERSNYENLRDEIVEAQKKTYSKAAVVHKIALVAYWSMNTKQVELVTESLSKTSEFAKANAMETAAIDVAKL